MGVAPLELAALHGAATLEHGQIAVHRLDDDGCAEVLVHVVT